MTDFPTLSYTSTSEIRTLPFHILEACMKKIKIPPPLQEELPRMGYNEEYPPDKKEFKSLRDFKL